MFATKTKINIFDIFSSDPEWKKISKNVDFSVCGDRATMQTHIWNWIFFYILAHSGLSGVIPNFLHFLHFLYINKLPCVL